MHHLSSQLDNQGGGSIGKIGLGIVSDVKIEKKRYEWIDNARIVAAWLIVCVHMHIVFPDNPYINSQIATDLAKETTFFGRVPFFLILAGYFLGRRITWSKAFDRALWLFIPFAIWNFLFYAACSHVFPLDYVKVLHDIPGMLGIGAVFTIDNTVFGLPLSCPSIAATWFLRDIIVLSLLTPILVKAKKYLLLVAFIAGTLYQGNLYDDLSTHVMLTPTVVIFYLLGVALSDYRISDAYLILNKSFTPFLFFGFLAALGYILYAAYASLPPFPCTVVGCVFGALMIAQCGVLLENHCPKLSKRLAPCGPACFLVFVLHYPFLLVARIYVLPEWFYTSCWAWSLSLITCVVIIAIFLLMKRYLPWLMPYLGHMKVSK